MVNYCFGPERSPTRPPTDLWPYSYTLTLSEAKEELLHIASPHHRAVGGNNFRSRFDYIFYGLVAEDFGAHHRHRRFIGEFYNGHRSHQVEYPAPFCIIYE